MAKSTAAKQLATAKQQRLIYVGPTLKGHTLIKYQVLSAAILRTLPMCLRLARKSKGCLCR